MDNSLIVKEIHGQCYIAPKYEIAFKTFKSYKYPICFIVESFEEKNPNAYRSFDALSDPLDLFTEFIYTADELRKSQEFNRYFGIYILFIKYWNSGVYEERSNTPLSEIENIFSVTKIHNYIEACKDYFVSENNLDSKRLSNVLLRFINRYGLPRFDITDIESIVILDETIRPTFMITNGESLCSIAIMFLAALYCFSENELNIDKLSFSALHLELKLELSSEQSIPTGIVTTKINDGFSPSTQNSSNTFINIWSCIIMAYILGKTKNKDVVRFCKNCGNAFVVENKRSEYCSQKCKSCYSSRMNRIKKKLSN